MSASALASHHHKQQSSSQNENQNQQPPGDDIMAKRRMRRPAVIDCLVLSTSSGYSTASEEAEPSSAVLAPSSTDNIAVPPPPQTADAVHKSSKRKTRAPTAPITPSQKRIKVESITNYNCTATSTPTSSEASAPPPISSSSSMHSSVDGSVLCTKPPLPPKATTAHNGNGDTRSTATKALKTKCYSDNRKQAALLNKLSAYADQCRLEIADLKLALANEKAAVRSLR